MTGHIALRAAGLPLALVAALSACTQRPDLPVAAADPASRAATAAYRPVLSGYESARPAEPKPWRERNESVAPKEKAR